MLEPLSALSSFLPSSKQRSHLILDDSQRSVCLQLSQALLAARNERMPIVISRTATATTSHTFVGRAACGGYERFCYIFVHCRSTSAKGLIHVALVSATIYVSLLSDRNGFRYK